MLLPARDCFRGKGCFQSGAVSSQGLFPARGSFQPRVFSGQGFFPAHRFVQTKAASRTGLVSNQTLVKIVLGIFHRQVFSNARSFPAAGAFQPGVVSRA